MSARIDSERAPHHAEHLRALARRWQGELASLGRRPRSRGCRAQRPASVLAPWRDRQCAIAGALDLADEVEAATRSEPKAAGDHFQRVVALRTAGVPYRAIAEELDLPVGTVKTWARRERLAAGGGA